MRLALVLAGGLLTASVAAQGTHADYERLASLAGKWGSKLKKFEPMMQWLEGGKGLVFRHHAGDVDEFVCVTATGAVTRAQDASELGLELPLALLPQTDKGRSPRVGAATTVRFENALERTVRLFWIDERGRAQAYGEIEPHGQRDQPTFVGHRWFGDLGAADAGAGDRTGIFVAAPLPGRAVFGAESLERAKEGSNAVVYEPVYIANHNAWYRDPDGKAHELSADGSRKDPYARPVHISPDGSKAIVFQVEPGERHEIHMVESRPFGRVQPKLHTMPYRKAGDRIDRPRPRLFDLQTPGRVAVDAAPFADAWRIRPVQWAADSSEVFLLHNRRGHQVLTLFAIDAATGAVRTVLEERSDTFVDYSQKTYLHWLEGGKALLWTSERSGFNHLYHVDSKTGAMRQLTRGDWLVRGVEHVDEAAREIWFTAYGIHPEQDPYHAHLARVDFDGGNLKVLTAGDGTHAWEFSPDRTLFVDRWSRVDHVEVTELRNARTGERIAELGRDDATALLAADWQAPERFVAKGRDGATDIWGLIIRPSNFDPDRRYPVIEAIYAGPHGHHVPKRWGLGLRHRRLAELGFVIVQIDGMGTNWRSRAFHDVCWRNLKDAGFPDRIAWLRAAASARSWMDLSRVGIFGGSAGGQNALAALLHHGDFYDVAVSDCGCHDNRMDKIWWNEAWMGWPVGPWYADNSNVTHAAKLQGKVLLTVGELDRNVDPASTMQVVAALIAADKDFDLVVYPGADHGIGEGHYLQRRRQDFFVRHLYGAEPRRHR